MVATYGRDGITPGRVVCLGYDLDHNGTVLRYPWLYIVAATGDTLLGVLFNNDNRHNAHPSFYVTTVDEVATRNGGPVSSVVSHPLTVIDWWAESVAEFLAAPSTFPDVTLPSVAPAPAPDLSGDMIPREDVVRKLTRAAEIASEYAENNDLCGEFERCMEAIGLQDLGLRSLRKRERTYAVTVEVPVVRRETVSHVVYVDAYDEDDAAERFGDNGGLRTWVYRASEIDSDLDTWDDVDLDSVEIMEVETA